MKRRTALPILVAATALATASAGTAVAGHAAFSDAAGTHEAGIHWLAGSGVSSGCGGDRFCTGDPVTRGQMATFLHKLSGTAGIPPTVNADKVDGLDAEQLRGQAGPAGPVGEQGPRGQQGPAGAGTASSVHVVDDGYLTLTAGNGNEWFHTCNYGQPSSGSETFWFSSESSPAATVTETFVGGGVTDTYAFPSIPYGNGGTNRINPTSWPYQAVATLNEGGVLTRWDVTATGSEGGPCTYTVYQTGPGTITVSEPR